MMKIKFYSLWISLFIIIVFLIQNILSGFTDLFLLNEKAISNFEMWRFLTAIFLHGSLTHLLFNLFALLFFGISLENLIGSKKFLVVFLSSGIIANMVSINFYNSSLGASGAIYGIIGAITILKPLMMVYTLGLIMPMFIATIIYITADVLRIFGAFDSNVGSIAHLSGIFIGFLAGVYLRLNANKLDKKLKIKIDEDYMNSWEDRFIK